MSPRPGRTLRTRRAVRAALGLAACGALVALAGCSSGRIDPPRHGSIYGDNESEADRTPGGTDSLAAWAARARESWASGESMRADVAGALARDAFTASWAQAADDRETAERASTTERLPVVLKDTPPTPQAVSDALARVGLAADVVEATGHPALWQVTVSDPLGSASAATEFWAWPDSKSGGALPRLQALPPRAPARRQFGPDAVGGIVSWTDAKTARLVSAWARPRGRGGVSVAVAERKLEGGAVYAVKSSQVLPVEADSIAFAPAAGGGGRLPALLVTGAGERDVLFDDCPTCPHLDRLQVYASSGDAYRLSEEHVRPSPYAALVSFLHALKEGGYDSALPYVTDASVISEALQLGLDQQGGALRAAPGTTAMDLTESYRTPAGQGLQFTMEPRGDRWVVGDVRAVSVAIE